MPRELPWKLYLELWAVFMASALCTLETVRVWPHFPLPRPGYGLRLGCGPYG
jgi:hypothetical protein